METWRLLGAGILTALLWILEISAGPGAFGIWAQFILAAAVLMLSRDLISSGMDRLLVRWRLEGGGLHSLAAVLAFFYSFAAGVLWQQGILAAPYLDGGPVGQGCPSLHFATSATLALALCLGRFLRERGERRLRSQWARTVEPEVRDSQREKEPDALPALPAPEKSSSPNGNSAPKGARRIQRLDWDGLMVSLAAPGREPALVAGKIAGWLARWWPALAGGLSLAVLLAALGPAGLGKNVASGLIAFLVLSAPGAFSSVYRDWKAAGVIRSLSRGFNLKNAEVLERLAGVQTVCFNKFGTITSGCPQVTDVLPAQPGVSPEQIVYLASILELQTDHPIRDALLLRSSENCRTIPQAKGYRYQSGRGARAIFQGQEMVLGSLRYLEELGISCDAIEQPVQCLTADGKTVLVLARSEQVLGIVAFVDDRRREAQGALARIQELGIATAVLSGDQRHTVEALTWDLGVDEVHPELSQEQATQLVRDLKAQGRRPALVASGVAYATALAQAEASIAFGTGLDGPIKTADVVLEGRDLYSIPEVLEIARRTFKAMSWMVALLFAYHLATLSLAIWIFSAISFSQGGYFGSWSGSWLNWPQNLVSQHSLWLNRLPAVLGLISGILPALSIWAAGRQAAGDPAAGAAVPLETQKIKPRNLVAAP
ncbi:MAG: cation-translocating P-type ATPase [Planctomycetes bacterium]|nr:cation-translocating P-type ATPase [Planctomycetota bacterium]